MMDVYLNGRYAALPENWRETPQPITGWVPPTDVTVRIVCAANKAATSKGDVIFAGARHCDTTMQSQFDLLDDSEGAPDELAVLHAEQGFIDQFGRFWSRRQAMQICEIEGQPVNFERQGGNPYILYSEGLY